MTGVSLLAAVALGLVVAQDLPEPKGLPAPEPAPASLPGQDYSFPAAAEVAKGAPVIYSYFPDAAPDEGFFLRGAGLASQAGAGLILWGPSASGAKGAQYEATVKAASPEGMLATIPGGIPDGMYLAWPVRDKVAGLPVRINAPELWWVSPDKVSAGETLWLFGRNLAVRPSSVDAHVWAVGPHGGEWLPAQPVGSTRLVVRIPPTAAPGDWKVWVYAGMGGKYGWSEAAKFEVTPHRAQITALNGAAQGITADDGQDAVPAIEKALAAAGPSRVVELPAGTVTLGSPLVLTDGQKLRGSQKGQTILTLSPDVKPEVFRRQTRVKWGNAVGSIETPGDYLTWHIKVPAAGKWAVWALYAADNAQYGIQDMGGRTTLEAAGGQPVALENLPNTGGFGEYKWSQVAELDLAAGEQDLTWRNVKGGGLNLDKFVLSLAPAWKPDTGPLQSGDQLIVVEAEDYAQGYGKDWPVPDRAVVTVAGKDCGLEDLTILGTPVCTTGVWVSGAEDTLISNVSVGDIPAAGDGAAGIKVAQSRRVRIENSTIRGRSPVYFDDVRDVWVTGCTLVPSHGSGNGALGAFLGNAPILHCVITNNHVVNPAGTPETMRLLWWNTMGGCTAENFVAFNGGEGFGGQPGNDQNVGEAILFETNLTQPYYGAPADAGADWLELPEEGPDWDMLKKLTLGRYAAVVVSGPGAGEARLINGLDGRRLSVERPWRVPPTADSLVVITELFYRNEIIGNNISGAMTGVQLWENGVQNIVAGNYLDHMRREGILLFSDVNKLVPTQTPGWNSGIGTCFYNLVADNHVSDADYGIRVNVGSPLAWADNQPVPWAPSMGNVVRHNTVSDCRTAGLGVDLRSADQPLDRVPGRLMLGTVFEENLVRDCPTGLICSQRAAYSLVRRNDFYFWTTPHDASIGLDVDKLTEALVQESNEYEGPQGSYADWIKRIDMH